MSLGRWPLWIRCMAGGLIWGAGMYLVLADEPRTVVQALVYVAGGLLFGFLMWLAVGRLESRLYGDLTDAERQSVVTAIRTTTPPADPRLRDAAEAVSRHWARREPNPTQFAAVLAVALLSSVYVALSVSPWMWILATLIPALIAFGYRNERRQYRDALRYREALTPR